MLNLMVNEVTPDFRKLNFICKEKGVYIFTNTHDIAHKLEIFFKVYFLKIVS
jgi:hypothetical protein